MAEAPKYSLCCGARIFNVGGSMKPKYKCARCSKPCNPLVRGTWKDVYNGK